MLEAHSKVRRDETIRVSVSLKSIDYEQIAQIAAQKKVSNAWVIREAVEKYINAMAPLFKEDAR